jgi:hypothetical protein
MRLEIRYGAAEYRAHEGELGADRALMSWMGKAYGNKPPYDFVGVADIPYSIFVRDTRYRLRCHHKDPCFADYSDYLHRRR